MSKLLTEKTKVSKRNKNDIIAYISYAKIIDTPHNELEVLDLDTASTYYIRGSDLINRTLSADSFAETKKVTKTVLAETLVSSYNVPFTLNFNKVDGTERILRGRLIKPEPLFGKSMVEDLDQLDGKRVRFVIHENINWMIVNDVKYVRK